MGKQKHDIGHQKRNLTNRPEPPENTVDLARSLIERGLASTWIIDIPHGRTRK